MHTHCWSHHYVQGLIGKGTGGGVVVLASVDSEGSIRGRGGRWRAQINCQYPSLVGMDQCLSIASSYEGSKMTHQRPRYSHFIVVSKPVLEGQNTPLLSLVPFWLVVALPQEGRYRCVVHKGSLPQLEVWDGQRLGPTVDDWHTHMRNNSTLALPRHLLSMLPPAHWIPPPTHRV